MRLPGWRCLAVLAPFCVSACAGQVPDTRYYDLASAAGSAVANGPTLVIEPLVADEAYDDERIVYRENPYRVDYYHYHRWSARPGVLVAAHLERALEASGRFGAIVRQEESEAHFVLGGRVIAIEEVDISRLRWVGRISLELHLKDTRAGKIVWSRQFDEVEPVRNQTPEGVARALSRALDRIARRVAPEISAVVSQRTNVRVTGANL